MDQAVTVDHAIDVLNEALSLDAKAITDLVNARVACNEAMADHSTIQVGIFDNEYKVGLLGILNGIFGADINGWGFIAANFNDNGEITKFARRG